MDIAPIAKSLMRNRVGPILLALQVAVTLGFLVNAFYIVNDRIEEMNRPTGVDLENTFRISVTGMDRDYSSASSLPGDLQAIRAIDGVHAVTTTNSIPLGGSGWMTNFAVGPEEDAHDVVGAQYMVGETALEAFGLELVAGRGFRPEEIHDYARGESMVIQSAILTRAVADQLFPEGDAVGRSLYMPHAGPTQIVGVVDFLGTPWASFGDYDLSVLVPLVDTGPHTDLVVRAEPGRLDEVMPKVEQALIDRDPSRLVHRQIALAEVASEAYEDHRAMSIIMVTVGAMLLVVNVLGIVGLASFQVNRRRRQIGTRRALGASRGTIVRHFMTETGIIVTVGLAAGLLLTIGINFAMMRLLEFDRLDLTWLPPAAAILFVLGQIAVLGPARRAASIPPAIATRAS
ncbi:MAG: FtsX-like permease family protein [Wenzhouxiangella sp.]|jgi:putative ABC transport system permease protein|nr:FtsX-like permease family protein [Wenzhouxiangella sp.]